MRSIDENMLARRWKNEEKSYAEITKLLDISRNSTINFLMKLYFLIIHLSDVNKFKQIYPFT